MIPSAKKAYQQVIRLGDPRQQAIARGNLADMAEVSQPTRDERKGKDKR